jgi:selenocysteine-specific elongation factor
MRVIGTAGHVDHGKSTLIEALTGINPDRLKEEREREMTIDLGFAWMSMPDGEEIGIIDVPGHRDFIENMLAGIGGIDAALFVVAADEGIMPQTREHLAILDILQIPAGVIALTKIELVNEPDWLELVEEDIRKALKGTMLGSAPIVKVSARQGIGLDVLIQNITNVLASSPIRVDNAKPRLPVDRVFTIAGFGTVVTGTLSDGSLQVGDEIEILPRELRARIRGLQTHKRKEKTALPGSRTAVNISSVDVDQIERGDVVTHPGDYRPTRRMDVRFRLLPDVSQPLRHNTYVKLFIGASEVVARVRLLGFDELLPGNDAWLQLELDSPVVAVRGDRYILRRPSPGETLGGGEIVDPFPIRRYKRFSSEALQRLDSLAGGTSAEILLQTLNSPGISSLSQAISRSELDPESSQQAIKELDESGDLIFLEVDGKEKANSGKESLVTSSSYWAQLTAKLLNQLDRFYKDNPLKKGMVREELKSRLKLSPRIFNAVVGALSREGKLLENGPIVSLPGHQVSFSKSQELGIQKLMQFFVDSPFSPPSVKDCKEIVGIDVYEALVESGRLVQVSSEVVFSQITYGRMVEELKKLILEKGAVSAAQVRDHFNTSRKYVLAFLEHLDGIGLTVRQGDVRRLK